MSAEQMGEENLSGSENIKIYLPESLNDGDAGLRSYQDFYDQRIPEEQIDNLRNDVPREIEQACIRIPDHNEAYLRIWGIENEVSSSGIDNEQHNISRVNNRRVNISLRDIVRFLMQ